MSIAGKVIVIHGPKNGAPQASLGKALQDWFAIPYYTVGQNVLKNEFMPFDTECHDQSPYIRGLNAAASAMARSGCNVIIDYCLEDAKDFEALETALSGLEVFWISLGEKAPFKADLIVDGVLSEMVRKIGMHIENSVPTIAPKTRWVPDLPPCAGKKGHVVVLYGTSSAGKSTLSRAIQKLSPKPFIHIGLDNICLATLPQSYLGFANPGEDLPSFVANEKARLGFYIIPPNIPENPTNYIRQQVGPIGRLSMSALFNAIVAIASEGVNVVTDQIFMYKDWYEEAKERFKGLPVLWVFMSPDLATVLKYETVRGNRIAGFAEGHIHQMFNEISPDLVIPNREKTPEENASIVLKKLFSIT